MRYSIILNLKIKKLEKQFILSVIALVIIAIIIKLYNYSIIKYASFLLFIYWSIRMWGLSFDMENFLHECFYVQFQEYKTNHPILAMDSRRTMRFLRSSEFRKAELDDNEVAIIHRYKRILFAPLAIFLFLIFTNLL